MKKFGKILGIIFLVLIAIAIVIPLMVDVDQFRPKIVKVANENMNGSLKLGSLHLSLWGKIRIEIDGLSVQDSHNRSLVKVKDASFDVPFLSILSGSPLVTLRMVEPQIHMVRNKDGSLNLLNLKKKSTETQENAQAGEGAEESDSETKANVELPELLANARIGVSIENAAVDFVDQKTGAKNTIHQLNLRVQDLALNRETDIELSAQIKHEDGKGLVLEGPLSFVAQLEPVVSGGEFKSAAMKAKLIADDLLIVSGDLFRKEKGVPANFVFEGKLDQDRLDLKTAELNFHKAKVNVNGSYSKIQGSDIQFKAAKIELADWSTLIPMMKEYELEGALSLNGELKGVSEALEYKADLDLNDFSMIGPYLKAKPVLNAKIQVVTDAVQSFTANLKGPGNELDLKGSVRSFTRPQVQFALTSAGLDLDQWIEFPEKDAKAKSAPAPAGQASGDQKNVASAGGGRDAMLDPLRKNEIAKNAVVDGQVKIKFIQAMGTRLDDVSMSLQMKDLVAAMKNLRFKSFGGLVQGGFTTDMKPKVPQYTMNLSVSQFDLKKAVESQFSSFKNTIVGVLSAQINGGGASFETEQAKRNLQLKGSFSVKDAVFKTIDVAQIANEAINQSMDKIASKVPALAKKKISIPSDRRSEYQEVSGSFTLVNGMLNAPDFSAQAKPNRGIDLKGKTKMGILDESIDADWELIDQYQMTKANKISVNIGGKEVKNILAQTETGAVMIPISVGCKWSAPCVNYGKVPEYLAGVAAKRVAGVATQAVKEKAQDAVKKAVGDQFKRLFGN